VKHVKPVSVFVIQISLLKANNVKVKQHACCGKWLSLKLITHFGPT